MGVFLFYRIAALPHIHWWRWRTNMQCLSSALKKSLTPINNRLQDGRKVLRIKRPACSRTFPSALCEPMLPFCTNHRSVRTQHVAPLSSLASTQRLPLRLVNDRYLLSEEGRIGRTTLRSADGKSVGTFCLTLPVAAHSNPRNSNVWKPTHATAGQNSGVFSPPIWPNIRCRIRALP